MEGGASSLAAGDATAAAASEAPSSSSSSSVEALLSVPLDLILRELPAPPASAATTATGAPRRKPRRRTLLSRSEATTLLRVTQLSIEQDVLVQLASDVLANAHMCSTLRQRIEDSCRVLYGGTSNGGDGNNNGNASGNSGEMVPPVRYPRHLLALLPILSVHADSIPDRTVRHVQAESQRILAELAQCATTLRQCAEHNWTVSEHLLVDVGGAVGDGAGGTTTGSNVGRDKESLAEIEEAVCDRIEGLIGMAMDTGSVSKRGDTDDDTNTKSPASSRKRKRGTEDASGAIPKDVFDVSVDCASGEFVSMAELCCRLFPDLRDEITQEAKVEAGGGAGENTTTNTAGGGEKTGESSSGVESMDVDKPPLADDGTTPSVAKELVEANGDIDNQASESSTANNIDGGKMESSGAKSQSNDDEDNDSDDKGSETKKSELSKTNNDEDEDLPRDASSSSSPSQSQVNAAAALAVLAST